MHESQNGGAPGPDEIISLETLPVLTVALLEKRVAPAVAAQPEDMLSSRDVTTMRHASPK